MTFWPVTHVVSSRVLALALGGMPDPDVWPDGNQASSHTRWNAASAILYRKGVTSHLGLQHPSRGLKDAGSVLTWPSKWKRWPMALCSSL